MKRRRRTQTTTRPTVARSGGARRAGQGRAGQGRAACAGMTMGAGASISTHVAALLSLAGMKESLASRRVGLDSCC
eukprot:750487-Hanusia_phi.AAC.1